VSYKAKTATDKNVSANSILVFISFSAWHRKIVSRDEWSCVKKLLDQLVKNV